MSFLKIQEFEIESWNSIFLDTVQKLNFLNVYLGKYILSAREVE